MKKRFSFDVTSLLNIPAQDEQATTRLEPVALAQNPLVRYVACFVAGLLVGLVILGWWLWPVQWVDAWPVDLSPQEQALYLEMVSDLYAYSLDPDYALRALRSWPDATVICDLAMRQTDWGTRVRLVSIAAIKNGQGCPVQGGE
jgi:hypothetical protein